MRRARLGWVALRSASADQRRGNWLSAWTLASARPSASASPHSATARRSLSASWARRPAEWRARKAKSMNVHPPPMAVEWSGKVCAASGTPATAKTMSSQLSALIVLAVAGVPLAAQTFPLHSTAIGGGWTFMLLAFLALHSAGRRAHEADSDRRAVALCGDADALGRALAKVHALSQLPRRWSAEAERSATHPSLARRIQAIRAEAGLPSIELGSPIVVRVLTPGCFVILEAERASWLDGVPAGTPAEPAILREHAAAVQSLRYSELTELRVRAAAAGAAALVAKGRAGFARTVP